MLRRVYKKANSSNQPSPPRDTKATPNNHDGAMPRVGRFLPWCASHNRIHTLIDRPLLRVALCFSSHEADQERDGGNDSPRIEASQLLIRAKRKHRCWDVPFRFGKSLGIDHPECCFAHKKRGPGCLTLMIYRAPGAPIAPNPRHESRQLCQRATTAQKVNSINTPSRIVSAIVISMLWSLNLSRAEASAPRAEKCWKCGR